MPLQEKSKQASYTRKLEELIETQALLSSQLEPKEILSSLALSALALLDAESVEVWQSPSRSFEEEKDIHLSLELAEGLTAYTNPKALFKIPGSEVHKEKNEFFISNLLSLLTRYFRSLPQNKVSKKAQMPFAYGRSLIYCVFAIKNEMRGLITVSRRENSSFAPEDHYFLKRLALQAGICIGNGADYQHLRRSFEKAKKDLIFFRKQEELLGTSPAMRLLRETIARAAPSQASILITGERGTGKEIVANLLHQKSNRSDGPFIKINCAGLSEELLESELFGYEKGAFTGAEKTRKGLFEAAHKGTIFLDEIAEMSPKLQARLLRVLQNHSIRRVGGHEEIPVDVRVVSATNQNIMQDFDEKRFRRDLLDRIATIVLQTPPLRAHPEDIELLAFYFLEKYKKIEGLSHIPSPSKAVLEVLKNYTWPGNVRELENAMHQFVILQEESFMLHFLTSMIDEKNTVNQDQKKPLNDARRAFRQDHSFVFAGSRNFLQGGGDLIPYKDAKAHFEREFLLYALQQFQGNLSHTAKATGIDRSNLRGKLKKHGIRAKDFRR